MIVSNRLLWMAAAVLCLLSLLAACGGRPSATEGLPVPTRTDAQATGDFFVSPAATDTPTVGVSVLPTPGVATSAPLPTASDEFGAATGVPEEEAVTDQPNIPSPPEPGLEPLVTQAKEDLAQRLSVPVDQIKVLETKAVDWPDASLGCPQPGTLYAQVLTPGFVILLEAEGQEYEYHTDRERLAVLCAGQPQAPLDPPAANRLPIFVEMVQAPLSADLSPEMPPADFGPTGVFEYDPISRSLLVQPSVQLLPTTEVLVGLTSATMPNRPYLPSDLYQIPSSQPTPLSVIAIDAESGTLTLAYAGQTFELRPGENRSFKQKGEGELAVVQVTTITNHGRLADIGLLPADPGSR